MGFLFVALKWHYRIKLSSFLIAVPSAVEYERLLEVKLENKALWGIVADCERVKRTFGPEEVERAVESARRREAQEREQKKAKRKFSRGAR